MSRLAPDSKFSRGKMPEERISASELVHIEQLMRTAFEALSHAQTLLGARLDMRSEHPCQPPAGQLPADSADVDISFLRRKGNGSECTRPATIEGRIRRLAPRASRGGAAILRNLLEQPGDFIDQRDLAKAAGVTSGSSHVVKVYICHLRKALEYHGFGASVIETGWKSYAIKADAVPSIFTFLNRS